MKRNLLLTILAAGGLVIAGVILAANRSDYSPTPSGSEPETNQVLGLTLNNYNNQPVKLADFQGKPLVINSWAAWCPFCVKELEDFATVQQEFGDQVTIIAVNRAESRDTAKEYSDRLGVTDRLVFLLDPADSFYKGIGGFSMPETIFLDKNGSVSFHKRGPMDAEEMRERVKELTLK